MALWGYLSPNSLGAVFRVLINSGSSTSRNMRYLDTFDGD